MTEPKPLTLQEWERVLRDFGSDPEAARQKWMVEYPGQSLLDQALATIGKKEVPSKLQLLVFVQEQAEVLVGDQVELGFTAMVASTRTLMQAAVDGSGVTNMLKEQMMVTAAVVAVVLDAVHTAVKALEGLVELLLGFVSRTNFAADRHVRGVACECLRELEVAYPCLLHLCLGHVFNLCQAERTHVCQSYTLLLTTIVHNVCSYMYVASSRVSDAPQAILSTAVPLVPFSVPLFLRPAGEEGSGIPVRELTRTGLKEFRRLVAFLLERPDLLTEFGLLEFVAKLIDIAKGLELQGSLLKHQFSSLMHTYSPVLCHVLLMMRGSFMDSFTADEGEIMKRLILVCRGGSYPLPFRLLAVHWLLGMEVKHAERQREWGLVGLVSGVYPMLFDPLSLKAAKLGALAHCAACIQTGCVGAGPGTSDTASQVLSRGLLCVSAYKWLPADSTETRLAFHMLHRFLTLGVAHSTHVSATEIGLFTQSDLFKTLQEILLSMGMELRRLVPSLLSLTDRLLLCKCHKLLGDLLLHTFNDRLVPRLQPGLHLPAYFPLFERMAANTHLAPTALLQLIPRYVTGLMEAFKGSGEGWVLWMRGSQVLSICRTLMAHHHSSRILGALSELLAFLTQHFPDLELRDSARMYLRLLITVPGKRLRHILNSGEEQKEDGAGVSSFLRSSSLPAVEVKKRKLRVAAYVVLSREKPLTVPHSWSMVLYDAMESTFFKTSSKLKQPDVVHPAPENPPDLEEDVLILESAGLGSAKQVPRVLDAATSEIVTILRRHFSEIPDFYFGTGFQVHVRCELRFQGEVKLRLLAEAEAKGQSVEPETSVWQSWSTWPALYAVVIHFSTSGSYGPIPKLRIPFLPSLRPSSTGNRRGKQMLLEGGKADEEKTSPGASTSSPLEEDVKEAVVEAKEAAELEEDSFVQKLVIALEPKQPVPTLVEAKIAFGDEGGHTVRGQLDSIPIGFEDLFARPPCPQDVASHDEAQYRCDLYHALWEACEGSGKLGGETFFLKGGKSGIDMRGTESVKLLEGRARRVVDAVEQWLAPYVVAVGGGPILSDARIQSSFQDVVWQEDADYFIRHARPLSIMPPLVRHYRGEEAPLLLEYKKELALVESSSNNGDGGGGVGTNMDLGCFHILIFLPPRYHLMFKMEVSEYSTLVRIKTDHWPCLAYVDEYLEALILVR